MAVEKERVSVNLIRPHLDALARLVKDGAFPNQEAAITAGVRLLIKKYGLDFIYPEAGG